MPKNKKSCVDQNDMKNHLLVTYLCFIAIVLEKNLSYPMFLHTSTHTISATIQSTYHAGDSTETAILNAVNDLLLSLEKAACLYMLCFSLHRYLTQLIILSLFTVPILTLD